MDVKVVKITPDLASQMLGHNYDRNRRLDFRHVSKLAHSMRSGEWKLTGDTIKVDSFGNVIDGQHRLNAVVKSDTPIEFMVAFGVDQNSYAVLDQGKRRTFSDYVRGLGIDNATNVSGAVTLVHNYSTERRLTRPMKSEVSILTLIETLNNEVDLIDFSTKGKTLGKRFGFSGSVFTSFFYIVNLTETESANDFYEALAHGADLSVGDPAFAFNNVMLGRLSKTPERRYSQDHYTALLIRAWNAHAKGSRLTALKGRSANSGHVQIFDPEGNLDRRWPIKSK